MYLPEKQRRTSMNRLMYSMLFVAGGLAACVLPAASAEQSAITWTAEDAGLKWGPCPPFLPQGCQIAVLQGDPGMPNADVFFKVPAKAKLPLHWHSSAER